MLESATQDDTGSGNALKRIPVVVALSGGVDSAVAAALLVEQGYDVTGIMLKLWAESGTGGDRINRGSTPAGVARARSVAGQLGIPFRLVNAQQEFREAIVDYFVSEYTSGRMPSPCVACNRTIRFGLLLDMVLRSGAEFLATGHYARVRRDGERYILLRGVDRAQDQSYFLHSLGQLQLAHVLFPLGQMTKVEVYEAARHRGLAVDVQSERQDLCFLADHDYRRFLVERVPEFFRSGPVRDARGYVLGKHRGLPTYTIGQRYDTAAAESLYVLDIVTRTNTLIVGTREELGRTMCLVGPMHYVGDRVPGRSFRANAQFRSRAQPTTATVTPLSDERARVDFDVPQHDVTPGQFLVLSNGEEIIGGGVILPRH